MPLYPYFCEKCKTKKEIRMSFEEHSKQIITCNCGNIMLQEVVGSKFVLSGSGWYRDSYSNTFNQKEHESEIRTFDQNRERQDQIERDFK